jgi:hypothetical protein
MTARCNRRKQSKRRIQDGENEPQRTQRGKAATEAARATAEYAKYANAKEKTYSGYALDSLCFGTTLKRELQLRGDGCSRWSSTFRLPVPAQRGIKYIAPKPISSLSLSLRSLRSLRFNRRRILSCARAAPRPHSTLDTRCASAYLAVHVASETSVDHRGS